MATRKRSELEQELMTPANIQRVIKLLNPEDTTQKPITKKDACGILGMAYNTTRLAQVIEDYEKKVALDKKRRAALRGKPATQDEVVYAIQEYLSGETIDAISKSTFRSPGFIRQILDGHAVPIRAQAHDYFRPSFIPDEAVRDRFSVGEVVYSARYDSTAEITAEQSSDKHGWVYRIWLLSEKQLQSAYQPAYELASLEHLRNIGVKI